jgi:hypothetical protein
MFDYIPIVTDRMVLGIMKNAMERGALDLYFRPFTKNAWIMVLATIITITIVLLSLSHLGQYLTNQDEILKRINRLVLFMAWTCYLLIEVYYEGALTMFFTTEMGVPFDSINDVMKAYPDWRLLMRSGFEAYYINHVDAGDEDYIKFWNRVKEYPEENTFSGIEEAITKHSRSPVVIHDMEGSIDTYSKSGKGDAMDHLAIFDKGRTEWYGLIVTENSPLGPILKYGANKLHERGVFDHLTAKWLGGGAGCRPVVDMSASNMVLGLKHVSLIFVILGSLMILSFIMFLAELYKKYCTQYLISSSRADLGDNKPNKKETFNSSTIEEMESINDGEEKADKRSIFNFVWNL